jgi:hypothetical protein
MGFPRLDAFIAYLFHKSWNIIKQDLLNDFEEVRLTRKIREEINCSFFNRNPKERNLDDNSRFRPISLYNIS